MVCPNCSVSTTEVSKVEVGGKIITGKLYECPGCEAAFILDGGQLQNVSLLKEV